MTREEIVEGLKLFEDNMVHFDKLQNDKGELIDVHELLFEAIQALSQEPTSEMVHVETLRQVMWERDIAIEQLHELGYEWGQKIEPCDDGIDHEKIRKAFAKESDIKKADIADMIPKVIMQAEEETDRFIFETIRPYCEEITQKEISKEILSKALTQYFSKPTECDDAISREAVLEGIAEWIVDGYADSEADCSHISSLVTQLPSVTHKSGMWIEKEFRKEEYVLTGKCSVCGRVRVIDEFCSCCGAKMESGDKG